MSRQFQELLLAHLPKLRAYALVLTRNPADADDLLHSAAERILKFEAHFEMGTNFSGWAYRILKNSHISSCRKKRVPLDSLTTTTEQGSIPLALVYSAPQEEQVFTAEVSRALFRLKPNLREVLTLICVAELSYIEVSTALSCSVGTVKSRLWRAREQMRLMLLPPEDVAASNTRTGAETGQTFHTAAP